MSFDLRSVPFSRFGSYLAVSEMPGPEELHGAPHAGLWLRQVGGVGEREVLRLEVLADGEPVPFEVTTSPSLLTLRSDRATVELCFDVGRFAESPPGAPGPFPIPPHGRTIDILRVRSRGLGLRLSGPRARADSGTVPWVAGRWLLNLFRCYGTYVLVPLAGTLRVEAPWVVNHSEYVQADFLPHETTGAMEAAVEAWQLAPVPLAHARPFDACVAEAQADFERLAGALPAVPAAAPAAYAEARKLAAYIDWSCTVAPRGGLTRPAIFMSKNWMAGVWSWDHCFNAMALCTAAPDLAWDQMLLLFDRQAASGQLPDMISDAAEVWNFVKPPVHGWALRYMLRIAPETDHKRLREIYPRLAAWTDWWFTYRDPDGAGLPVYLHGNDSGWDNATVFDAGVPVIGADLAAYLVVQMDVLADLAARLGKAGEAAAWQARADATLDRLLARLWRGDHFVSPRADGTIAGGESLFNCLPIVLGDRLPAGIRSRLAEQIGTFLTPHGPATEHLTSPYYIADGYWRGPIWAAATLILADGLASAGEHDLARDLARRFCDLVAKSGCAENYDAVSGAPLRDRAYTWTASSFFVLAREYLAL